MLPFARIVCCLVLFACLLAASSVGAQVLAPVIVHNFGTAGVDITIQTSSGDFYGLLGNDVDEYSAAGKVTKLYVWDNTTYGTDFNSLILAADGYFYGTSFYGGDTYTSSGTTYGYGTVFKISSAGAFTLLHTFRSSESGSPVGPLVPYKDGSFYGVTSSANGVLNPPIAGSIYKITSAGTLTTLYTFPMGDYAVEPKGGNPAAALTLGSDGNFYGTTAGGGTYTDDNGNVINALGTIFKMTPVGALTTLYTFDGTDGGTPDTALIQGGDGNFYGTTSGLPSGVFSTVPTDTHGTIFRVTPQGVLTTLYRFQGGADGSSPSNLLLANDGNFYGTTASGGNFKAGTVFQITPAGAFTTLGQFGAGANTDAKITPGAYEPVNLGSEVNSVGSALIQGIDGSLYGSGVVTQTASGSTTATTSGVLYRLVAASAITSPAAATAQVGQPFSYQITATAPATSYSSDALPAGLTLNAATGIISGTPINLGTYPLNVYATTASGIDGLGITITVAPPSPVITSGLPPGGHVGTQYATYKITATNSPTSFGVLGLPPGLTLNTVTGQITGVPMQGGDFAVTLVATNAGGSGTLAYTITIVSNPPAVTSSASASGLIGRAFSYQIVASNSPTSYNAAGLPAGLTVDTGSGLISGVPTATGDFTVTLSAANNGGAGTGTLTLSITAPAVDLQAVNILSPPTNIVIVAGETIDLEVAVDARGGTLASVEFDVTDAAGNKTYLGNSTAPRDHKTWNPTALGDFTLSAIAADIAGGIARSEIPIHVVAGNNPPVSQLLSGLNGKSFAAGSSLPLVALATDASGQPLSNVQFYLDGVLVPGVTSAAVSAAGAGAAHRQDAAASPYAKANAKLGDLVGDALLTMTGTDSRGVTSVSNAATIHTTAATAAFSCAIASPDGSATYAPGASVTATATALETGGSVAQVEYFLNDHSVGVATGAGFTLDFALPATAGQYALTAIATDTAGVSAASAPVILSDGKSGVTPPAGVPVVTIAAAGNTSVEEGTNVKLVVRRTGDMSQAITVRYKPAGAARAGTDYKPLGDSVTLAAGVASAKVKLKTIDNQTVDGTRVAKIKLLPSADGSYTLGNPATAKLKIIDND